VEHLTGGAISELMLSHEVEEDKAMNVSLNSEGTPTGKTPIRDPDAAQEDSLKQRLEDMREN